MARAVSDAFERLEELRVVPVLTIANADQAEQACRALAAGGLRAVEITFRTDAATDAIRRASPSTGPRRRRHRPHAGAASGGDRRGRGFAVAPRPTPVIETARAPACRSSPASRRRRDRDARALGCDVLKVFPAAILGGPAFVKAVSAVYRDVRFVPTGGIDADNLASYLELPSVLACGGTWICEPALLLAGRFDEVERRARDAAERSRWRRAA